MHLFFLLCAIATAPVASAKPASKQRHHIIRFEQYSNGTLSSNADDGQGTPLFRSLMM
jgi:hypothetical protein